MGQKVNPHGLRVGVIKNWDSRWFAKDEVFGDTLVSDYKLRKYLKEKLQGAGVPKIETERDANRVKVFIHCAKPGVVIGRGGAEIDKLKLDIAGVLEMPAENVVVNVVEVKSPDLNAQLVAENIAAQLENRVSFRRAMKKCLQSSMRAGAKGIKTSVAGRLGGADIARSEGYHEGSIPLQTLRADIEYGFWEANTTYGKIGVKVWIYRGEVLSEVNRQAQARDDRRPPRRDNRDRRDNRGGDRRDNRPRDGRRNPNPNGNKTEGGNR